MLTVLLGRAIVDAGQKISYKGGMRTVKSNLSILMGQKSQREGRRITLRTVSDETGVSRHTVYAIADNTIREYPKSAIVKLCDYFSCELHELLVLGPETVEV